jgi:hypothetical protein
MAGNASIFADDILENDHDRGLAGIAVNHPIKSLKVTLCVTISSE